MSDHESKTLSNEEMRKNLLTSDYKGVAYKKECLEELLERERIKTITIISQENKWKRIWKILTQ